MVTSRRLALLGLTAGLAACGGSSAGGTTAHHQSPRQALLTAAHLASTQSFRVDFTIGERLNGSGAKAPSLGLTGFSLSGNGRFNVAGANRSDGTLAFTVAGHSVDVAVTTLDGTIYVSTDGGATYRSMAVTSHLEDQYGPGSALRFLDAVGTVADRGSAVADGVKVERYHATLDPAKMSAMVRDQLSSMNSGPISEVVGALQFQGGGLDATIDGSGRLVTETGTLGAGVDLGKVEPSMSGTSISFELTLSSHFYDYGAHIAVSKPANVTGTNGLP